MGLPLMRSLCKASTVITMQDQTDPGMYATPSFYLLSVAYFVIVIVIQCVCDGNICIELLTASPPGRV